MQPVLGDDGLACQRLVVGGKRLVVAFEISAQNQAAADPQGFTHVGLQRERPVIAGKRLRMPLQVAQRAPAVVPGAGVIGLGRQRQFIARERFRRAA